MEDINIIRAVQKRPTLYDINDPNFSNRDVSTLLWEDCARELQTEVEYVKRKWAYLRDYLAKQYRQRAYMDSSTVELKQRKWPLFERMSFLVPYLHQLQVNGNVTEDVDTKEACCHEDDNCLIDDTEDDMPKQLGNQYSNYQVHVVSRNVDSSRVNKHKDKKASKKLAKHIKIALANMKHKKQFKNGQMCLGDFLSAPNEREAMDEHEHFFQSIIPALRSLDSISVLEFRLEVQKLLLRHLKSQETTGGTSEMCIATTTTELPV